MERTAIEDSFRNKTVSVLCCTATALDTCLHLVATRVIIRSPYVGNEFVSNVQYHKMLKYRGIDKYCDSITIFNKQDQAKLIKMLKAPTNRPTTDLHKSNCQGVTKLLLTAIGIGIAVCRNDLCKLLSKTLLSVQAPRLNLNLDQILNESIRKLYDLKAIDGVYSDNGAAKMVLSKLGMSSVHSGLEFHHCIVLHDTIIKSKPSDNLQLLYMITPYEPNDLNAPINNQSYYQQVTTNCPLSTCFLIPSNHFPDNFLLVYTIELITTRASSNTWPYRSLFSTHNNWAVVSG